VKIHVEAFWVATSCSDVVAYQRFGGPYCFHLQVVTPCGDVVGHQRFGGSCCQDLSSPLRNPEVQDLIGSATEFSVQDVLDYFIKL